MHRPHYALHISGKTWQSIAGHTAFDDANPQLHALHRRALSGCKNLSTSGEGWSNTAQALARRSEQEAA